MELAENGTAFAEAEAEARAMSPEPERTTLVDPVTGRVFLASPGGGLDFGRLNADVGSTRGPIRYEASGRQHVRGHLSEIQQAGYDDDVALVSDVAENHNVIYQGKNGTLLLAKKNGLARIAFVEAIPDGDFYQINTALVARPDYLKNKKPLWERAQSSQAEADASSPPSAVSGQSGITKPSIPQGGAASTPPAPQTFLTASDGGESFGDLEAGERTGPVRYSGQDITPGQTQQIESAGYPDAATLIEDVTQNRTAVYPGQNGRVQMVKPMDGGKNVAVVDAVPDGDGWRATRGYIAPASLFAKRRPLTGSQTAKSEPQQDLSRIGETQTAPVAPQAANAPAPVQTPIPAEIAPPEPAAAAEWRAVTPRENVTVGGRWRVVEADDLVTSDREGYDPALQQRNRDTITSQAQIESIAANPNPMLLLDNPNTDGGAPIVDGQGRVISGNGRTMGLRRAYESDTAEAYRQAVIREAQARGLGDVSGMRRPVLVREMTDTGGATLKRVADLSNQAKILQMTPAEQAQADADVVDGIVDMFKPDEAGNIRAASNTDFLAQFVQGTGADNLIQSDGSFSPEIDGRVHRAILASVFRRSESGRRAVQEVFENAEEFGIRKVLTGISQSAGRLLKLSNERPGLDLAPALGEALRDYANHKKEMAAGRVKSLDETLAQRDMFDERAQIVEILMREMDTRGAKSAAALKALLDRYARLAQNVADPNTASLFGEEVPDTRPMEILENARRELAEEEGTGGQRSLPGADAGNRVRQAARAKPDAPNAGQGRGPDAQGEVGGPRYYTEEMTLDEFREVFHGKLRYKGNTQSGKVYEYRKHLGNHQYSTTSITVPEGGDPVEELYDRFPSLRKKEQSSQGAMFSTAPRLAPNGQPSNLNAHQWAQVRTPAFKRWGGDWEAWGHRQFLEGEPVARLTGEEFQKGKGTIGERVGKWFESELKNKVEDTPLGTVRVDRRAAQRSFFHGFSSTKAAAFKAIPEILQKGILLPLEQTKPKIQSFLVGAPIDIGGKHYVGVAMIHRDVNMQRLYVHEVVLTEHLRDAAKRSADKNQLVATAAPGDIRSVLHHIFSVKPPSVLLDENGEPKVFYHGSADTINVFSNEERGRTTGAESAKKGFFFASDKRVSDGYSQFARPKNVDASKANYERLERIAQSKNTQKAWDDYEKAYAEYESAELDYARTGRSNNVVAAYLSIKNPMTHDYNGDKFRDKSFAELMDDAIRGGNDGVIFKNTYDGNGMPGSYDNPLTDIVAVFSPAQIKSATGNTGAFDPDNPDIRFSTAPPSGSNIPQTTWTRYRLAAFTAAMVHGQDRAAYRQAMLDQHGPAVEPYLDEFANDYDTAYAAAVQRAQQAARMQAPPERPRPDLGRIGTSQEAQTDLDRVDATRENPERGQADWERQADEWLAATPEPEAIAAIRAKAENGESLTPGETKAAHRLYDILHERWVQSGDPEDRQAALEFAAAYRDTGSTVSDEMNARKIPTTPAGVAHWLMEHLTAPGRALERRIGAARAVTRDKSKTGAQKATARRVLTKLLKKQGQQVDQKAA